MTDVDKLLAAAGAASGNPLFSVGSAILGGLFGGQSSTQTQTANREPWGPAQELLKNQIANTGQLQNYYQQNPFSPMQQAAYRNAFAQNDSMRAAAPGVLQRLSSNQYFDRGQPLQRPQAFDFTPKADTSLGLNGKSQALSPLLDGLFSNPYTNGAIKPLQGPSVAAIGPNTVATDGSRGNDSISSNSTPDWGAAVALGQALSGYGLNTIGDHLQSEGRMGVNAQTGAYSQDAQNQRAAEASAMSDAAATSANAAQAQAEASDRDSGDLSTGGSVTPQHLHGPDPRGPDDGYTALQKGEYVIKKSAVNKYGQGLLDAINQGKLPAKALRGLL